MRGFCLEVAGEFACFTRPEMKVERVSYDVITPSAARAIFDAILWKPAIRWRVTKIEVLQPIRWASIRRNEVAKVSTPDSDGFFIDDVPEKKIRQQRASLLLRDVRYRLHAEFDFIPPDKRAKIRNPAPEWLTDAEEAELYRQAEAAAARPDEKAAKYAAMFERRALKGQHFARPYLGCREFSCTEIRLIQSLAGEPAPIAETRDLGFMLYDMDYSDPKDIKPMFYRAQMQSGVIAVPALDSSEVFR
ncbi:MAG: type I-C CRISPR-associated protein Cas5 [Rhodocyclaceae bacterium]|nr:type I-C CRISPR-associated protein Cas5 [Rhodocyclaceae bacterium]